MGLYQLMRPTWFIFPRLWFRYRFRENEYKYTRWAEDAECTLAWLISFLKYFVKMPALYMSTATASAGAASLLKIFAAVRKWHARLQVLMPMLHKYIVPMKAHIIYWFSSFILNIAFMVLSSKTKSIVVIFRHYCNCYCRSRPHTSFIELSTAIFR